MSAVLDGLNEIGWALIASGVELDIPKGKNLTSYYARASWSTIGANECKIDESIIDMGLAHFKDKDLKMLGKYVTRTWDRENAANRQIIDYYLKVTLPETGYDYSI